MSQHFNPFPFIKYRGVSLLFALGRAIRYNLLFLPYKRVFSAFLYASPEYFRRLSDLPYRFYTLFLTYSLLIVFGCSKKEQQKPVAAVVDKPKVNQVVGIASIEPVDRVLSISSDVNGIVDEVIHLSGEQVKKGEVLFTLIRDVEKAQLDQALSKLATQQAIIVSQKASAESIRIKQENAKVTWERNQKMWNGGAVTQQTVDDSRTNYESLGTDLAAAVANIKQQQSRLTELQQDIHYYRAVLNRKSILAPANGTILNLDLKKGSVVTSNASVGDFGPEGPWMAITEVDELFADKVAIGQLGYVREQGARDTLTTGKVIFVSPYLKKKSLFSDKADDLEDRRVREVRLQLDNKNAVLIGSRLECVISLKK